MKVYFKAKSIQNYNFLIFMFCLIIENNIMVAPQFFKTQGMHRHRVSKYRVEILHFLLQLS